MSQEFISINEKINELRDKFYALENKINDTAESNKNILLSIKALSIKFDILAVEGIEGMRKSAEASKTKKTPKKAAADDDTVSVSSGNIGHTKINSIVPVDTVAPPVNEEKTGDAEKKSRPKRSRKKPQITEDPMKLQSNDELISPAVAESAATNMAGGAKSSGRNKASKTSKKKAPPKIENNIPATEDEQIRNDVIKNMRPNKNAGILAKKVKPINRIEYFKKIINENENCDKAVAEIMGAEKIPVDAEHAEHWKKLKGDTLKKAKFTAYYEAICHNKKLLDILMSMRDAYNSAENKKIIRVNEIEKDDDIENDGDAEKEGDVEKKVNKNTRIVKKVEKEVDEADDGSDADIQSSHSEVTDESIKDSENDDLMD